ncbi:hypothetical protein ACVW16_005348 [Bradyrhizobium sp. USDA 4474]
MTDLKNNAPRRYFVNAGGQRVLIGLTPEETVEFERLDGQSVANLEEVACAKGVLWRVTGELRWQELYAKHEGAWKTWIDQNRGERPAGFSLY